MKMSKFTNFLKEAWGWFVAILVVVSGWFLIEKFFLDKSDKEEELLTKIKDAQDKIDSLENEVEDKIEKEKELEKEQAKVQEKIDNIKTDVKKKEEEFKKKKKKVKESTHKDKLDYMNQKYSKKGS